ncbi:dihydroneopterin aldolase domain protein [Penicillium chrysogenum]|uniref:dihydroneopterin aldolase n=1 Tax=Penicillium chrysogenum TaxID=5076 RepID=A0ABQ8W719_PENCH|nr:dihydroneopterin aldolase domain protein [Penicillium chrysogenum]KAJ5237537.1 dihydroneopterin aldolase domain protein [Penicillium chrysogenum]KAJ5256475.1 dihydroneopterin aldolase domain protein [Penicillium chrysogenum]KAJ5277688.1 dihydroneopterin aldolase domain protein [Penicillium chrysogenum]KAJ6160131.1 dihydroneopterin aldolase domain protein [Penicillium chrysogenum]
MANLRTSLSIEPRPDIADTIQLRNIQLPLPVAPEAWHRGGKKQPCNVSFRLTYASSAAAAESDDVKKTIDYGKLFKRLDAELDGLISDNSSEVARECGVLRGDGEELHENLRGEVGQDVRLAAALIAKCGMKQLEETASNTSSDPSPAVRGDFGEFEVELRLPKAVLRADGGLYYRGKSALAVVKGETSPSAEKRLAILEEEFKIENIRCYCILGINPWERLEKQAVHISLAFNGPALQQWGSKFVDTYQKLTLEVAERVESSSFGSVESLASLIARIVVVEFGHEKVTVLVQKPSALAFVEGSGLEITRSRDFFQ